MFAGRAKEAHFNHPLAYLVVGERPDPVVPESWIRVRATRASLNRHDIFTLCGVTAQEQAEPLFNVPGSWEMMAPGTLEEMKAMMSFISLPACSPRRALRFRWRKPAKQSA